MGNYPERDEINPRYKKRKKKKKKTKEPPKHYKLRVRAELPKFSEESVLSRAISHTTKGQETR